MRPFVREFRALCECEAQTPLPRAAAARLLDVYYGVSSTSTRSLSQTAWPRWLPALAVLLHSRIADAQPAAPSSPDFVAVDKAAAIMDCIRRLASISPATGAAACHDPDSQHSTLPDQTPPSPIGNNNNDDDDTSGALARLDPALAAVIWVLVRTARSPTSRRDLRQPTHVGALAFSPRSTSSPTKGSPLSGTIKIDPSVFDVSGNSATDLPCIFSMRSFHASASSPCPPTYFGLPSSLLGNDMSLVSTDGLTHDAHSDKDDGSASWPDSAYDSLGSTLDPSSSVSAAIANASAAAAAADLDMCIEIQPETDHPILSWERLGGPAQSATATAAPAAEASAAGCTPFITEAPFDVFDALCRSNFSPPPGTQMPAEITLSERFVAACMLQIAVGVPSAVFNVDHDTRTASLRSESSMPPSARVRIASLSTAALESILRDAACLGTLHLRIRGLAEDLAASPHKHGLTGSALAYALDGVLADTHALIIRLEGALDRERLHVLAVIEMMHDQSMRLQYISDLFGCNLEKDDCKPLPSGCEILTILYDALLSIDLLDVHPFRSTLMTLFCAAARPMLAWMDCWLGLNVSTDQLQFGSSNDAEMLTLRNLAAHDPYGEFFVTAAPELQSNDESATPRRPSFFLCTSPHSRKWPSFISDELAAQVLEAGTSWRLLRRCANTYTHPILFYPSVQGAPSMRSRIGCTSFAEASVIQTTAKQYRSAQLALWSREITARVNSLRHERNQRRKTLIRAAEDIRVKDLQVLQQHAEAQHALQTKRDQLRESITQFLAHRASERESQQHADQLRQAEELKRDIAAAAERDRLVSVESEAMLADFEKQMMDLEKAEARLLWRQQRLALDAQRRVFFERPWVAEESIGTDDVAHVDDVKIDDHADEQVHLVDDDEKKVQQPEAQKQSDIDDHDDARKSSTEDVPSDHPVLLVSDENAVPATGSTDQHVTMTPEEESQAVCDVVDSDIASSSNVHQDNEPAAAAAVGDIVDAIDVIDAPEASHTVEAFQEIQDSNVTTQDQQVDVDENTQQVTKDVAVATKDDDAIILSVLSEHELSETSVTVSVGESVDLRQDNQPGVTFEQRSVTLTESPSKPHTLPIHNDNAPFVGPFGFADRLPGFFNCAGSDASISQIHITDKDNRNLETQKLADTKNDVVTDMYPITALMSRSLFRVWHTQMRLVSRAVLMMLFAGEMDTDINDDRDRNHVGFNDVRFHIGVLESYLCLRDGPFVVGIKAALFSGNGTGATSDCGSGSDGSLFGVGLGLNGGGTWPPRLHGLSAVFDTILASSLSPISTHLSMIIDTQNELPVNRTSHDALAFLHLVYAPPPPFDMVITPSIVRALDDVFHWLLRLVQADEALSRILISSGYRRLFSHGSSSSSSIECTHTMRLVHAARVVVHGLVVFAFETVVGAGWRQLRDALDKVARRVTRVFNKHHRRDGSDDDIDEDSDDDDDQDEGVSDNTENSASVSHLARSIVDLGSLRDAVGDTVYTIRDRLFLRRPRRQTVSPTRSHGHQSAPDNIGMKASLSVSATPKTTTTDRHDRHHCTHEEEYIGHVLDTILEIVMTLSRRMQELDSDQHDGDGGVYASVLSLDAAFRVRTKILVDALRDEVVGAGNDTDSTGRISTARRYGTRRAHTPSVHHDATESGLKHGGDSASLMRDRIRHRRRHSPGHRFFGHDLYPVHVRASDLLAVLEPLVTTTAT